MTLLCRSEQLALNKSSLKLLLIKINYHPDQLVEPDKTGLPCSVKTLDEVEREDVAPGPVLPFPAVSFNGLTHFGFPVRKKVSFGVISFKYFLPININ
jgi:hypothetical protein